MGCPRNVLLILTSVFCNVLEPAIACSNGECQLKDKCNSDKDCATGLYCFKSCKTFDQQCARSTFSDPFKIVNDSLPFNKYAFLTSHNSYATNGMSYSSKGGFSGAHEDNSVTKQLNSGVRALMLNTFEYKDEVWLCHRCDYDTSFQSIGPALELFKEVEAFLTSNPSQIVTIILEDRVNTPNKLGEVFDVSGLTKYLLPILKMPQYGGDWPLVKHMVANNQRLVVFTSTKSKQESEGIAYLWNFMVEYRYGNEGMHTNHVGSLKVNDTSKSLILLNYVYSEPEEKGKNNLYSRLVFGPCKEMNTKHLINTLHNCYIATGNRWTNFISLDYSKRRDGGGAFQAVDFLNGKHLCGSDDVNSCKVAEERLPADEL